MFKTLQIKNKLAFIKGNNFITIVPKNQ